MSDETPTDESVVPGLEGPENNLSLPDRMLVGDEYIPQPDDMPEEEQPLPDPKNADPTELTEEERDQFRHLLTIGKRTKTVTIFDHTIVISSLMTDDDLILGEKVKQYRDNPNYSAIYRAATVAASIQSVDGERWGQSLFADADKSVVFEQKFTKVLSMHNLVTQYIYNEVVTLDVEFADLAAKLGKL